MTFTELEKQVLVLCTGVNEKGEMVPVVPLSPEQAAMKLGISVSLVLKLEKKAKRKAQTSLQAL